MNPSRIIYQETSPYSAFTAFLEEDERTTYLYLQCENNPEWGIKSLWIRNHTVAPLERDPDDFQKGLAPILLKHEITQPEGLPSFKPEDIHFIWTEEGDGLFLFLGDEMEAFLPSWSGVKGFHGYARGAREDAITASPLGDPNNGILYDRMIASRKYWEGRSSKDSWKNIQKNRLEYLESKFGKHEKYWSADGGKFPELGIAKFRPSHLPNISVFVTIGMSAQNQPSVELYHKDYEKFARIELLLAFQIPESSDRSEEWVQHLIGEMIKFPWNTGKWFGHGHTLGMNRKDPDQLYLDFNSTILRNLSHSELSNNSLPDLSDQQTENGQPANYLAIIPLTEEEKMICQTEGSSKIFKALDERGFGWIHNPEREFLFV
ncbi:suppressor of fused domain protein [Leptospira sp. GIMC2001]|uniref:suppressor of fused domain protein n=1 Tax=Leptospira sp. GIMC2001 TaxID=1513297 RepID=UPI00234BF2D0|nr:suppressor of fused domain protein [Leptospira sp. GIMC2001]WCL49688.1 suppressor of fused domain protein [Leptospira sp. GIMC2001]